MNKNRTFKILGDVYHILSYSSADELLNAARELESSPGIAAALRALAEEVSVAQRSDKKTEPKSLKKISSKMGRGDNIQRVISKSEVLSDKAAIVSYAKEVGIKLTVNPKDAYPRVLSKFASAVKKLEPEKRHQVIERLQTSKLSEIEGWINVIQQPKGT